jgi:hypothetical protein
LILPVEQLAVAWEEPWGYFPPSVRVAEAEQQDEEIEP